MAPRSSFLTRSGHRLLEIPTSLGLTLVPWSADGRRFSYRVSAGKRTDVRIVDRGGRTAFERPGQDAFWAQRAPRVAIVGGLLGDALPGSTSVYGEAGHEIRHLSGRGETLSPDGREIHSGALACDSDRVPRRSPHSSAACGRGRISGLLAGRHTRGGPLLHDTVILTVSTGRVDLRLAAAGVWLPNGREMVVFDPRLTGAWILSRRGRRIRHVVLATGPNDEISSFAPTADGRSNSCTARRRARHVHRLFEQLPGGGLRQLTEPR